jgi:hypothetical protein
MLMTFQRWMDSASWEGRFAPGKVVRVRSREGAATRGGSVPGSIALSPSDER